MQSYAPVVVFTYARPEHTVKTLNALNNCQLANNTDLYIFCDNYKNDKTKDKVNEVRAIVDSFAKNSVFKKTRVSKSETNKGLARSVRQGVSEIIQKYGTVIVVEDDLLVSKHFLVYMNKALEYYETDNSIWSISGYSFMMKALENYNYDIYASGRACSWGWATWKDRWNSIDWNVTDYRKFKFNIRERRLFTRWGPDLARMLDSQVISNINSWAIIWCYQGFKERMNTIYPKKSLVINMGIDGSGVHQSTENLRYYTQLDEREEYDIQLCHIEPDEQIRKEFSERYSSGWYINLKANIKSFLLRIGINTDK